MLSKYKKLAINYLEEAIEESLQYREKGFWVVIEVNENRIFETKIIALFKNEDDCNNFCKHPPDFTTYAILEPAYVVWCMIGFQDAQKLEKVFISEMAAIEYCADYQFEAPNPVLWVKRIGEKFDFLDPCFDNGGKTKQQMIEAGELPLF